MKFSEAAAQTIDWLQREGRVSYRALKREFDLDDEFLEDLKAELIDAKRLAADEDGKVLVWVGMDSEGEKGKRGNGEKEKTSAVVNAPLLTQDSALRTQHSSAERRQLTVLFCDLVGSTALSARLDPEELRDVIRAYQQTCAEVIQRHDGYIAQYLGDGLLVYFGYPIAHEDDARRAVRAGLEIIEVLRTRGLKPLVSHLLQVRIGIHTGLVVVGDIGASGRTEQLALGETPNIAARVQGLAEPNTVIISAATHRLVESAFECQPFGSHFVKGLEIPIAVYHVQSERQSATPFARKTLLTPLVGREQEVGLLIDRWGQVKEGRGQVVLLSGEPGIGKSRLAYRLREQVTSEGSLLFEARCSPYHQQSALYPLIDVWQRTLLFARQDTEAEKVAKLERALALYEMPETLPLFTALLSLPTPATVPPLNLTPQKQKERTLQALLQLLLAQAERQATVLVWEDVHWADPSSLEFLTLLIDQLPTTKLLLVLTFRPEFVPPWPPRSHLSQLVLNRLGQRQVEAMIEKAAGGHDLPAEVIEQIRVKTDGVPLFVEELTKSIVEAREQVTGNGGQDGKTVEAVGIPATLQEALFARLDRLFDARPIAQLGATLGREFSYELLQAVALVNEIDLQTALTKLVEAEILYQRGIGQQSRYFFKHALIQDTAYQSLLKSTRQRYHQQIAQVLEERFPDTKEHQPELLAHHYTEAGLIEQAIPYWQKAGQGAVERSANVEAIGYLTKGLELLKDLPDTPERVQRELALHIALGTPLILVKGYAATEVASIYGRAWELCQQIGEAPQFFTVLRGLWFPYVVRAELQRARDLGLRLLQLAENTQDPALLLEAHFALALTLFWLGDFVSAQRHSELSLARYHPLQHSAHAFLYGQDPGVASATYATWTLWMLGYPEQALKRSQNVLTLAHALSHPFSLAIARVCTTSTHQYRREVQATGEWAEATISLSTEQGFPFWIAYGTILRGWVLVHQGQREEGLTWLHQGIAVYQGTGAELLRPYFMALLAEAYGQVGEAEKGLSVLADALAQVSKTTERQYEAELYRLKGELTLQSQVESHKSQVPNTQHLTPSIQAEAEAETYFLKAIDIARKQQAKSWELRASTSLARLRQQQGKNAEAHKLLADVYSWFTEGFDTKDLQEAKTLLAELSD